MWYLPPRCCCRRFGLSSLLEFLCCCFSFRMVFLLPYPVHRGNSKITAYLAVTSASLSLELVGSTVSNVMQCRQYMCAARPLSLFFFFFACITISLFCILAMTRAAVAPAYFGLAPCQSQVWPCECHSVQVDVPGIFSLLIFSFSPLVLGFFLFFAVVRSSLYLFLSKALSGWSC